MEQTAIRMQERFRFFATLSQDEVREFLRFCDVRRVGPGEALWQEGDQDNYAAFILSGRLGIKKRTDFASKHVIIGLYEAGSVVGELCLLTDNERSVSAVVMDEAELVILDSANFERLMVEQPTVALKLLKNIFVTTCKRLRKSYDRIASIF